jgi:hypothetical protein
MYILEGREVRACDNANSTAALPLTVTIVALVAVPVTGSTAYVPFAIGKKPVLDTHVSHHASRMLLYYKHNCKIKGTWSNLNCE